MAGIDETRPFVPLKIAVLTVSDTRELADDKSGATLVETHRGGRSRARRPRHRDRRRGDDPRPGENLDRRSGRRRRHHHRRHRLHRPRRDAGGGRAAVREAHGRLLDRVPPGELSARSAPRRSSRAPPPALPARPISSACRVRPAPAATPGTKSSCTSSTTATGRATSSRSCRGSTSICAGRRRARRSVVGWAKRAQRACPRVFSTIQHRSRNLRGGAQINGRVGTRREGAPLCPPYSPSSQFCPTRSWPKL